LKQYRDVTTHVFSRLSTLHNYNYGLHYVPRENNVLRGPWLCVVCTDELMRKYEELSRVREDLSEQLNRAINWEKLARANLKATEQANCTFVLCIEN